jgi:ABC-2 type transport system permease protein
MAARVTIHPSYLGVFKTFVRNSLVRDMTFRANFIIDSVGSLCWMLANLGFYSLIFRYTDSIGRQTGWGEFEFYAFLSTTLIINSLVQAFFMPNAEEFSELIRTGGLDFALLKPIDTQFLISLQRIEWSSLVNCVAGVVLLCFSLRQLTLDPAQPLNLTAPMVALYVFYVLCGVVIMYSLMITLAATSIWLGRNQTLYDFWFYITNFSRYPREIYAGKWGYPLQWSFTYLIPVLVVVNVPASMIARPLRGTSEFDWYLPAFAVLATGTSFLVSRWVFQRSLHSYRSASS